MLVDKEEVEKLAHLARLSLHEKEFADRIVADLDNILEFVAEINRVNTKDIAVMEHSRNTSLQTRTDTVTAGNERSEMQKDIPKDYCENGYYLVPKVVE